MVFSSVLFIWVFLPISIILYCIAATAPVKKESTSIRIKNRVLLLVSLCFYALGGWKYLMLLGGVLVINYLGGILVNSDEKILAKASLILTIIADLGALFCFKYLNLFVVIFENVSANQPAAQSFENIVKLTRTGFLDYTEIILPIGISFYIFQSISYVADIYKREATVQKNFFDFALYVSFFPQLIAGPIVKYSDVDKQIRSRKETFPLCAEGVGRFIYGLAKKVLIANTMAEIADEIWSMKLTGLGAGVTWLAAVCYTLQIYFDFSGYSDMAIGLGKIFGFNFKENFNYPYVSTSVKEFWRRWHISLSTWFKEYVYIPLGGSRKGLARNLINLFIVFLLTGIWHGANFTFIVWGLIYALFLIIERLFLGKILEKKQLKVVGWIYTMLIVIISWVFFRADNIYQAGEFITQMFSKGRGEYTIFSFLSMRGLIALVAGVILCTPIYKIVEKKIKDNEKVAKTFSLIETVWQIVLMLYSMVVIISGTYNPFIYFQF